MGVGAAIVCPKCGSAKIAPIVFGMPPAEYGELAKRSLLFLGGCLVSGEQDPDLHCFRCEHEWCDAAASRKLWRRVRAASRRGDGAAG